MTKLTGDEYIRFWQERMARGPEQAGHAAMKPDEVRKQGDLFREAMVKLLEKHGVRPGSMGELGSGWGRMAEMMTGRYPCDYTGIDLSPEAVEACTGKSLPGTLFLQGSRFPPEMEQRFDLIYTCTCLQHITDDAYFATACDSIMKALKPGAHLLMLENVVDAPQSRHIRGHGADGYLAPFTAAGFEVLGRGPDMKVKGEPHMAVLLRAPEGG